jgi:hypothetical protein
MAPLSDIVISPLVSLDIFLNTLVLFFLTLAFYLAVKILFHYDKNATSAYQYELEKQSFLLSTIIKIFLYIAIFMFALFVFSIDSLSTLIPGAMCGAGVVNSGEYGEFLIALKFVIITLAMLWISIDKKDQKGENFPYFTKKLYFYLFLYFLIVLAWFLELKFFLSLNVEEPVLCCSGIYKSDTDSFLFGLNIGTIVTLFYVVYVFILLSAYRRKKLLLAFFAMVFLYLSYISIVYFFGTYIYELPNHKCPYCLLSREYYFVGYFIYAALIGANYYVLQGVVFALNSTLRKKLTFAYTVFVALVSLKYIYYYLINNVLL